VGDAPEETSAKSLLQPGRNCWRVERAKRASLIVDAEDYYRRALRAMLEARSQIMLIGWDVDTRVRLADERPPEGAPTALGPLLSWLSKRRPDLDIYILVWDHAALSIPGRGTTMLRLARWAFKKRIHLKFDHSHPLAASHHQKILVVDDAIAFCGGIDITADRWDTREHKDEEPGRRRPFTRRVYEPWHDAIMALDGEAAEAIGDLARVRWKVATGRDLFVPAERGKVWPEDLRPAFRDVQVGIARTRGEEGNLKEIREIEALFIDLIRCAKSFVYVETQYFASRVIAEAIAERLEEPDCPEFVIVNPKTAYGWLDETVMSPARYELMKALQKKDRHDRFRIYYPVTDGGAEIYVHAKIMIVDDLYLRVGSANMNNRSMGLDSECDLLIDGVSSRETQRAIARVRTDLLAEHLCKEPDEVDQCFRETGSLIGCIEALRSEGRTLLRFEPEEPNKLKKEMAKSELLDPEGPDELFEPRARPGLLSGFGTIGRFDRSRRRR
jgi:phosphatidylserine/phosphatidylglycerophosphate/cardiolipin synthase-like enzyme